MRTQRGRLPLSLIDAISLTALAGIVLFIVLPQRRVRGLLRNEDDIIQYLGDLERREEAHRAAHRTDADHDGKGEYGPLGDVLGPVRAQYDRIEGTDIWRRDGYYFTVLLPNLDKRPVSALAPEVHPDYAEIAMLLVAWPAEPGRTGMRAYAIWPGGQLLQHAIDGYPYSRDPPAPGAPLIQYANGTPKPADRYDYKDWGSPAFTPGKR